MNTHQHLDLVREFVSDILDENISLPQQVFDLIYREEDDGPILPGQTLEEVIARLEGVLTWTRQPTDLPNVGRNRELRRDQTEYAKRHLCIRMRVALALLDAGASQ